MQKIKDLSDAEVLPGGYRHILNCRVCGSPKLSEILDLGNQYVVDFPKEPNPALPRAPLMLIRCEVCGLLQLSVSVDPNLLWRGDYWYRSSINESMRKALTDVVNHGFKYQAEGTWIDIGANDGFLLSKVPLTFKRIGVEPSRKLVPLLEEHADRVVNNFFNAEDLEPANVITSCACFYDVNDPARFIRDVASLLVDDGIWINQLSHAEAMLRQNAWDSICHEHAAYYSLRDLQRLYNENGMRIIECWENEVNGGSIRILAKKGKSITIYPEIARSEIEAFAVRARKWREEMRWLVDSIHGSGRTIWGLGASTKGCCLLQYLDRNKAITAIGDRNPLKNGLRMVGSWLPIVDEETCRDARPDYLLALPWSFKTELLERERETLARGSRMLMPLPNIEVCL